MQYDRLTNGYIVRLIRGEEVHAALGALIRDLEIPGGMITGLGAVEKVRLGYYKLQERRYIDKSFSGEYELVSLTGNIAWNEGEPIVHAHAVLSDAGMQLFGGHLFAATVAVTVEIAIHLSAGRLERGTDEVTGLNLLHLSGGRLE